MDEIKDRILKTAVEVFDQYGYHGATIRTIAQNADCSMPMMYYYYKSKTSLYEEVAVNQFFTLIQKMNGELDFKLPPADLYTQVVLQRQRLTPLEKAIYRIANRLWLGFEGTSEQRERIAAWEKNRIADNRKILDRYVKNGAVRQIFAEVFLGFIENEVNKIVFLDKKVDATYLKKQLEFLLSGVM